MLEELRVSNLGILEDAHLDPSKGLTVLTGETGTGKTLMLGAIELLAGKPFSESRIGPFGEESRVEARFSTPGEEAVVSKSLARGGRTKTRLNGNMAAVAEVGELIGEMVDIVAQHDHLSLAKPEKVRSLVDALLDDKGRKAAEAYASAWTQWTELQQQLKILGGDIRSMERQRELLEYQATEIAGANLQPGEEVSAGADADLLRNSGELSELAGQSLEALDEISELTGVLVDRLRKINEIAPDTSALLQGGDTLAAQTDELRGALRGRSEQIVHDPKALEGLEARLMLLSDLRRKYGETIDEVILFGTQAGEQETVLADALARAETVGIEQDRLSKKLSEHGALLSKARSRAAKTLCEVAIGHLTDLGFSTPTLSVVLESRPPRASGIDCPVLYFASDHRLKPGPVGQTASGGELSRLVLALYLAGARPSSTVVAFDEIDAGVGGAAALTLGRKLAELAKSQQVLCVTHLAQVAAFSDRHYVVQRNELGALAFEVEDDARLAELTRMLSGLEASIDGQRHASELLELAGS